MSPTPASPGRAFAPSIADLAWAHALARALTRDDDAADELVQEAALAVLRRPLTDAAPPRPWLARVVRNALANRRRSEARRRAHEPNANEPPPEPTPVDHAADLESHRRLTAAVAALEEPLRTTIVERYYHGRSVTEIARADSTAESTVRARIARGLELLRADLDRGHGGRREAWMSALVAFVARRRRPLAHAATTAGAGLGVLGWSFFCVCAAAIAWALLERDETPNAVLAALDRPTTIASESPTSASSSVLDTASLAPSSSSARAPVASGIVARGEAPIGYELRGRLVDEDDRPVADARVRIERSVLLLLDHGLMRGQDPSRSWDGGVETATDARGDFELHLPRPSLPPALAEFAPNGEPALGVDLVTAAPGRAPARWSGTLVPGERRDAGTLRAPRGRTIEGRVTVDGEGLADALVRAAWPELEPSQRAQWPWIELGARPVIASTRTDANGSYRLEGIAAPAARVYASAPRFDSRASATLELRGVDAVQAVELELRAKRGAMRGRVVDEAGAPIRGATVSALPSDPRWRVGATTNERGEFELALWMAEPHDVVAWGTTEHEGRAAERAVAPAREDVLLILRRERSLRVTVRASDGGALANAHVLVLPRGVSGPGRDFALDERTLTAECELPPLPATVIAQAKGCESAQRELDLAPSGPDSLEFVLERKPVARGLVVDASLAPVPGAQVRLVHPGPTLRDTELRTIVPGTIPVYGTGDGDGRFALERRADLPWCVRAEWPGHGTGETAIFAADAPNEELRIELRPFGSLRGRVVAADARRIPDTWVAASLGDGARATARVGADGRFAFDELAPGRWWLDLEVYDTRFGLSRASLHDAEPLSFVVESGRELDVVFDLDRRGRCTFAGRFELAETRRDLWTVALGTVPARILGVELVPIGDDGAFELATRTPGPVWIVARSEGADGGVRELRWPVVLAAGRVEAALSLPTVETTVIAPGAAGRTFLHRWRDDAGVQLETHFSIGSEERGTRLRLPCGPGTLHAVSSSGCESPEPLARIVLKAGEAVVLELPRAR